MSTNPAIEPKVRKFESVEGVDIGSRNKSDGFFAIPLYLSKLVALYNCISLSRIGTSNENFVFSGIRFRLVSYNILAQVYVKSALLPHSPPACLKWKARSHAILSVLKNLQADFFCLQEVDEYDSFYRNNMDSLGYSGIYIQRTGQRKRDGCAIFYKPSCAELVTKERIEYNDLVDSIKADSVSCSEQKIETSNEGKDSRKDSRDLNDPLVRLKRDCVGIMAAFRINKPFQHIVIVANTHLYWDPELADVKLAQAKYLLSRLAQFKTLISDEFECTPSLLLAGDFNSIPGDMV
jgi:CCR4-NOT transcription complex subunit 6